MRDFLIRGLIAASFLAACLPVAFILTLVLIPLWSWIEATYGIESLGHSGPADWCFWLVYAAIGLPVTVLVFACRRGAGQLSRN
jgi:hypothetical protein